MKKIGIVFLLALLTRLAYFWITPPRPANWDDASSWDNVGWNVSIGNGFLEEAGIPTPVRPPAYPLFLAMIYKMGGHNLQNVKIVQVIISALIPVILFLTGKKIFGEKIGFPTALLLCFYPPLIVYSTVIGSETLYTFLLVLSFWLLTIAYVDSSMKNYLWSGLLLGITNLCRSTLSFFPFFFLPLLGLFKKMKRDFWWFFISTILSFLVILPWTIRNYKAFGGFLLVNISAGQLFWAGTIEETGGRYMEGDYSGYRQFDDIKNPIERERAHFKAGLENIRKSPWGFTKLTFIKFFRLWFEPIGYTLTAKKSPTAATLLLLVHGGLILLAFYGILKSFPFSHLLFPLYTLFIYFTFMHNIIAPMPRFRLPIEPYVLLFATWGVYCLFMKVQAKYQGNRNSPSNNLGEQFF